MKLTESTYIQLRDDIFNARYKPNELITERQIAEKYGVSKLTAGEVLHRLCAEGHLTSYPRSGYMVTTLTPKEIRQLVEIRLAIETLVIKNICGEASGEAIRSLRNYITDSSALERNTSELNTRFHMGMAKLTDNRFLVTILQDILGSLSRVEQPIVDKGWQNYHGELVDALCERNVEKAVACLEKDLARL